MQKPAAEQLLCKVMQSTDVFLRSTCSSGRKATCAGQLFLRDCGGGFSADSLLDSLLHGEDEQRLSLEFCAATGARPVRTRLRQVTPQMDSGNQPMEEEVEYSEVNWAEPEHELRPFGAVKPKKPSWVEDVPHVRLDGFAIVWQ